MSECPSLLNNWILLLRLTECKAHIKRETDDMSECYKYRVSIHKQSISTDNSKDSVHNTLEFEIHNHSSFKLFGTKHILSNQEV